MYLVGCSTSFAKFDMATIIHILLTGGYTLKIAFEGEVNDICRSNG